MDLYISCILVVSSGLPQTPLGLGPLLMSPTTAQRGADHAVRITGIPILPSLAAISILSFTWGCSLPALAESMGLLSLSGCHNWKGISTLPHATRMFSRQ